MTTFYAYYIYVHIHMYVYNFVSCLKCKHFPIITYSSKTFSLWLYEEYNLWKHASEIFQFFSINQFSSVQSLSRVWLFVTPWIAARQASLSITNSQSSLRLTSIGSYYFQRKWVNLGFDWFFLTITDSEIALTRLVPLLHYLHDFG